MMLVTFLLQFKVWCLTLFTWNFSMSVIVVLLLANYQNWEIISVWMQIVEWTLTFFLLEFNYFNLLKTVNWSVMSLQIPIQHTDRWSYISWRLEYPWDPYRYSVYESMPLYMILIYCFLEILSDSSTNGSIQNDELSNVWQLTTCCNNFRWLHIFNFGFPHCWFKNNGCAFTSRVAWKYHTPSPCNGRTW